MNNGVISVFFLNFKIGLFIRSCVHFDRNSIYCHALLSVGWRLESERCGSTNDRYRYEIKLNIK